MATTWDWSPLVQAFGGFMQEQQQKRQLDQVLQSLLSPEGATTPAPQPAQGLIGRLLNPQARQQPQRSPLAQAQPMQPMNPEDITGDQVQPRNMVGMRAAPQTAQGGGLKEILARMMGGIGAQGGAVGQPSLAGGGGSDALRSGSPLGIDPRMADLLRKLPPQIGMPLLLQTMQSQMTPQAPTIAHEGDVLFDRSGRQIAAVPRAPKFGEKSVGINPATGKSEVFTLDEQGNPKFSGVSPGPSIEFVNGQAVDKNTGQPLAQPPIPQQAAPYRPLSQQELNDKVKLAGAETQARTDVATAAAAIDLSDPNDRSYIDSIANYKVRPPSAGRNPQQRRAVVEAALKINPEYNEARYDQSAKALRDFGTGKQGDTARSLNVSVAHLETLRELGRALQNGNVTLINAAKQRFSEEFGVPAPTNFDTAKSIVADEVAKGVIGGQSAQSDRETLAASLKRSGSFPVIEGAINTFQSLLGGQLKGLRSQYERTTGAKDFDQTFLSEETRNALEGGGDSGGGGGAKAPIRVNTPEEARKLPPNTPFQTPDGRVFTR